ncbi:hypothetical protein OF83DRAFT_1087549 [Amylostereum chailletii]|nr:hypothetical protein OF83DRAFT_1087549 [Amylostereum chailletii]
MLAQIFEEYVLGLVDDPEGYGNRSLQVSVCPHPPSLVTITHVCQRWRNVALTTPGLWIIQPVPVTSLDWTREVLNRSKAMPLNIRALYAKLRSQPILSVLQQLSRIESLRINLDYRRGSPSEVVEWGKITSMLADHPAPLLKTLQISGRLHYSESEHRVFRRVVILDTIFQGVFPQMTELTAAHVSLSSRSPLFHANLTSLTLESVTLWKTYTDMGATLRSTPQLRRLRIGVNIPHPDTLTPRDSIILPVLETLGVYGQTSHLSSVLKFISFPLKCVVTMEAYELTTEFLYGEILPSLWSIFSEHMKARATLGQKCSGLSFPVYEGYGPTGMFPCPSAHCFGVQLLALLPQGGWDLIFEFRLGIDSHPLYLDHEDVVVLHVPDTNWIFHAVSSWSALLRLNPTMVFTPPRELSALAIALSS